jgi:hypothetical protein
MWWRNRFNLLDHGDPYERLWWPLLRDEFNEYELLWRSHIVALTNRIDNSIPQTDDRWILIRDDPGIDSDVEQLVMQQYSIFYFLARASLVIKFEPHLFAEDAFIFLDIVCLNFVGLLGSWKRLAPKLFLRDELPLPTHFNARDPVVQIRRYRTAYVHHARIGKGHGVGWDHLPKWVADPRDNTGRRALWATSWREIQKLKQEEFESARQMAERLRRSLIAELNNAWKKIREGLDSRVNRPEYKRYFALNES